MTFPLLGIFVAGIIVGWVHDSLGRVGGTTVLLAWFVALGVCSLTAPGDSTTAAWRGFEGLLGSFAGIAVHGLWQHFRSKQAINT